MLFKEAKTKTHCLRTSFLMGMALLVLLPGCQQFELLAPQEPVTIRFLYGGSEAYFQELIEQFNEECPHITVELQSYGGGFFAPGRGSQEIDVFIGSQEMISFMLENDALISLNGLIAEDEDFNLSDFYPSTIQALSTEGERWGIPLAVDMLMVHYNKDLFDRAHAPYPDLGWTWDGFLERAIAVSNPDAGIFGYAYHFTGNLGFLEPMVFIYQRGGRVFDDLQRPTRATFNEPLNVEAMQWYGDLINKYGIAPRPGERTMPYPETGIEEGKYAMWLDWYSERHEGINEGVAPLPPGSAPGTMASVVGLFISSDSANPEASWEWAKFVSQQMFVDLVPARRSLAESDDYIRLAGEDSAAAVRASMEALISLNMDISGQLNSSWGIVADALSTALLKIRNGEDPQGALNEAQEKSGF